MFVSGIPINNIDRKIAMILLDLIEDKGEDAVITYKELSREINYIVDPRNIGKNLGDLSTICHLNGMPLISAIVINQDIGRPGNGFFICYEENTGIKVEDKDKVFIEEFRKVVNYDNWEELEEILELY